ncbi:uncharacterized protein LOC131625600 [Vicia villosa]|uniref:uncharacterized protein LOC131625600 n=1 Tax=Vicia villosa TaxID=3911 RepID=UPI00273AC561|nr:uncharacterized protein LOC131625600 [Vicia villosa]
MQAKRGLRKGDPLSPMLFVIVMEYLHRKLAELKNITNFKYHSNCAKLNIIDISFADDLLLFTRGNVNSVQLLMDRFHEFSKATCLYVNPTKCKLYCGGMNSSAMNQITEITGFGIGEPPFRYHGIPLSNKKLTVNQCMTLVDRIGACIKHWSSHLLSYSGRIQVINNVMFSTTNYWLQCIPLPKEVTRRLTALCRTFLWTGKGCVTRKTTIAWSKICEPKSQGGMNVIDLDKWNGAL